MGKTVLDEAGLKALGGEFLRAKRASEEAPLVPVGLELDQPHSGKPRRSEQHDPSKCPRRRLTQ